MSLSGEACIFIQAAADLLYEMVANVTRMGEWSPECRSCEWVGEAKGPVVGARFRGKNRFKWAGWTRSVVVTAAEPGRRFEFTTVPNWLLNDSTRWEYRFEPSDGGTEVIESYQVLRTPPWYIMVGDKLLGRSLDQTVPMQQTLARLKEAAERQAQARPASAAEV